MNPRRRSAVLMAAAAAMLGATPAATTSAAPPLFDMTFAELHELDNAYWFTEDCGVCRDQPDVLVSSFSDDVIAYVQQIAPDLEVSPGPALIAAFLLEGIRLPDGQRILQLPPVFGDQPLLTPEYIAAAHDAGYVIWVWPSNRELENQDAYRGFLVDGIDGLNINFPATSVAAVEEFVAST